MRMECKKNQQDVKNSELAAKRMGKLGGRPKKLDAEKIALARKLYDNPSNKVENICKVLGISKPSFYAYLYDRHKKL